MADDPEDLAPVLHDLHTTSPVRVVPMAPPGPSGEPSWPAAEPSWSAGEPPWRGTGRCYWLRVAGTIGGIGIVVDPGDNRADRVAHVADQLQDWVLECLPELGFPAVWPQCPEHPGSHPMQVGRAGGEPVWTCPRSATVHARVGELTGTV